MFKVYLELGFDHIADVHAYDHILFIVALCAGFSISEWKRILILVTAFTIGHSITLALSALGVLNISSYLIEILIPITILITSLQNIWRKPSNSHTWIPIYFLALFFGFIHGMGFANYFKSLLGRETSIVLPLFGFNVGVELGQICIVTLVLLLYVLVVKVGKIKHVYWTKIVSLIAAAVSVFMIIQRV